MAEENKKQEVIQKVPAAQEEIVAPAEDEKKLDAEIKEHKHPEKTDIKADEKKDQAKDENETLKKVPKMEIKKVKKTEAVVKGFDLPISTKYSMALCRFVKGKTTEQAMKDLNLVLKKKKVVKMKGEIPHRHGKGIMSGRWPQNASAHFIKLVKTLDANARQNGIEGDIKITSASATIASMPYGRFGKHRKKRTHVFLGTKVMEIKNKENNKMENNEPLKKVPKIK